MSELGNYYTLNLQPYSRDLLFNLNIHAFIPLLKKVSPKFCEILENENIITSLNPLQQKIIQLLIDKLIYDQNKTIQFGKEVLLDALFILGLFKNREFIDMKQKLTREFVLSITLPTFAFQFDKIEKLLVICLEQFKKDNYILEYLHNHCIEYAVVQMRTVQGNIVLRNQPILLRNASSVFAKMTTTVVSTITIKENVEIKHQFINSLYNDKNTSDVKIKFGENTYVHCHKTILSTSSTLFMALFESGANFSDLKDGVLTPDKSEDLELLEIVIKCCYGFQVEKVNYSKIVLLLDMAMKHEIQYLVQYCQDNFTLTIDNFFDMVEECKGYLEVPIFSRFFREITTFGVQNRQKLFTDDTKVSKLPVSIMQQMILNMSKINFN